MGTKEICVFNKCGACLCEGENCEVNIFVSGAIRPDPSYEGFKKCVANLETQNIKYDDYTKEGMAWLMWKAGREFEREEHSKVCAGEIS